MNKMLNIIFRLAQWLHYQLIVGLSLSPSNESGQYLDSEHYDKLQK